MLEELLGKRVIVVSTEPHPEHRYVNAHYAGILQPSPPGEVKLSKWNDRIVYYRMDTDDLGLDTRPTPKSKEVVIPQEKVRHVHALDKLQLLHEGGSSKKYIFHVRP